jgi:hypothetical protein
MPLLRSLAALEGHAAINMALLTELGLDIALWESADGMANTYERYRRSCWSRVDPYTCRS